MEIDNNPSEEDITKSKSRNLTSYILFVLSLLQIYLKIPFRLFLLLNDFRLQDNGQ